MTARFSKLTPDASIGIAGAGLLGKLLAWQLSSVGFRVSLFDAASTSNPRCAAHTAAGMLAPISEAAESGPEVYAMGLYGIERWNQWLNELGPSVATCIHQNGSLLVAHPQDENELHQFLADTHKLREEPGCSIQQVHSAELQQLEPDLSRQFQKGLLLSPEAHLDNRLLLQHLHEQLALQQVTIYENTSVIAAPFCIKNKNTAERHNFDLVLDCRGVGARETLSNLRGVRGETLHLETTEVILKRPVRLMHPRYQLYVVPKPNHRFVIGATQIESEDTSPISLQSSLELSSAVYTLAPAFAEARIVEAGVNLRPAFANNLPSVTDQPGLITANGLYRHGYLLAPAVVDYVMDVIRNTCQSPFGKLFKSANNFSSNTTTLSSEPVYE